MVESCVQPLKQEAPKEVTFIGNDSDVSPVFEKAALSICNPSAETVCGKFTSVKLLNPEKAEPPISFIPSGNVMLDRTLQPLKA